MARSVLICALFTLWSVGRGSDILERKGYSTEYPAEQSEYNTYNDFFTDEPSYTEPPEVRQNKVEFRCLSDGLFEYPPDSSRFIQCSNGRPFVMNCPEGLHFDSRKGGCSPHFSKEYPTEDPTDQSEYNTNNDFFTDEPSYTEPPEVRQKSRFRCLTDGLFVYPPDCRRFVQCSNGRAFVMKCPEGLHFSRLKGRCDYPCEARCTPDFREYCEKKKTNDVCSLPRFKGPCKSYVIRYYYEPSEGKCKQFAYGGCHANENNFKSEKQCLEVCGERVAEDITTTTRDSSDTYPTADHWGYSRLRDSGETTDEPRTSESDESWAGPELKATTRNDDYDPIDYVFKAERDPEEPRHPGSTDEDSGWYSTERTYSFKARVADDFQCPGTGAYRNPDDCASFIWCPLDRAIVVPCPPGTHYSKDRDECVDPCLAHCNYSLACACGWPECHQYNLIDCESDPDAGPCPDRELRYFYDRERGRCKSFYYGGCHGNGNNFRTLRECQKECQTTLIAGFRCPSYNGDFGHYPDCVSYYQCKRGIPTLKRCPKGTAFHHLKAKCVPEHEAMCVYECQEPNAVYPSPKDCRSYIDCVNGIPRLERCPRGLAFDANKGNCVPERTASCNW